MVVAVGGTVAGVAAAADPARETSVKAVEGCAGWALRRR